MRDPTTLADSKLKVVTSETQVSLANVLKNSGASTTHGCRHGGSDHTFGFEYEL